MKILKIILDVFFPTQCIACSKLCNLDDGICKQCAKNVSNSRHENLLPIIGDTLIFPFYYEGDIRKTMHRFKFMGRKNLAELLARQMAIAFKKADIPKVDFITYVPIHELRLRSRGYNQAELLANNMAKELNLPVCNAGLKRLDAGAQHALSGAQRRSGDMLSFEIDSHRLSGHALLVDDIYTTGTTTSTISAMLKSVGVSKVTVITAARVRPTMQNEYN